jgi:histone-lysine N-methyltransferase SETMAR
MDYYSSLLVQLKDILKEECHAVGRSPRGSCSCTTVHRALAAQKKLAYLGFQCLDHLPYFPDLAPSDYHLFPGLKRQLKGRHFLYDTQVIAAMEMWLDGQLS